MQAAKAWFKSRGDDAFTTTQRAYGAIYGMVQRNAAMLSFVKAFWVMAVVFFLIIPAVAILAVRKVEKRRDQRAQVLSSEF